MLRHYEILSLPHGVLVGTLLLTPTVKLAVIVERINVMVIVMNTNCAPSGVGNCISYIQFGLKWGLLGFSYVGCNWKERNDNVVV